jgi:hypothetical protein
MCQSKFLDLSREQRLVISGARIHELETRTPGMIDWDKYHRVNDVFWKLINNNITDEEWCEFCEADKMRKYLKFLEQ